MGRPQFLALIALSGLVLPSCSDQAIEPIAAVTLEHEQLEIEFPQEVRCWTENSSILCPLIIRENGTLTHQGVDFDPAESPRIEAEWKRRGYPVLGVAVHPFAQYDAVVERLSELEQAMPVANGMNGQATMGNQYEVYLPPRFALVEWQVRFSKVGERRNLDAASDLIERVFAGEIGEHEYGALVGYSDASNACAFKADGLTLNASELNDMAFQRLEHIVMRAGGPIKLLEEITPVARIQSDASTPWQCVAGAAYQLRVAGWPWIKFEVLPDRPKAADAQFSS